MKNVYIMVHHLHKSRVIVAYGIRMPKSRCKKDKQICRNKISWLLSSVPEPQSKKNWYEPK